MSEEKTPFEAMLETPEGRAHVQKVLDNLQAKWCPHDFFGSARFKEVLAASKAYLESPTDFEELDYDDVEECLPEVTAREFEWMVESILDNVETYQDPQLSFTHRLADYEGLTVRMMHGQGTAIQAWLASS